MAAHSLTPSTPPISPSGWLFAYVPRCRRFTPVNRYGRSVTYPDYSTSSVPNLRMRHFGCIGAAMGFCST